MTDAPNIGPPRDTMAAADCEFALRLYLMNHPDWWPGMHNQRVFVWPTLKSYQWMKTMSQQQEPMP